MRCCSKKSLKCITDSRDALSWIESGNHWSALKDVLIWSDVTSVWMLSFCNRVFRHLSLVSLKTIAWQTQDRGVREVIKQMSANGEEAKGRTCFSIIVCTFRVVTTTSLHLSLRMFFFLSWRFLYCLWSISYTTCRETRKASWITDCVHLFYFFSCPFYYDGKRECCSRQHNNDSNVLYFEKHVSFFTWCFQFYLDACCSFKQIQVAASKK